MDLLFHSGDGCAAIGMQAMHSMFGHQVRISTTLQTFESEAIRSLPDLGILDDAAAYPAALERVRKAVPELKLAIWTGGAPVEWLAHAASLGVGVIVSRSTPPGVVEECFRRGAEARRKVYDPQIEQAIFGLKSVKLTRREAQFLAFLGRGMGSQEIALRMGVTVNTVKQHAENIFAKTHINRRADVARIAARHIGPDPEAGIPQLLWIAPGPEQVAA